MGKKLTTGGLHVVISIGLPLLSLPLKWPLGTNPIFFPMVYFSWSFPGFPQQMITHEIICCNFRRNNPSNSTNGGEPKISSKNLPAASRIPQSNCAMVHHRLRVSSSWCWNASPTPEGLGSQKRTHFQQKSKNACCSVISKSLEWGSLITIAIARPRGQL